MAKAKTPSLPAVTAPKISPEEGIARLQEMVERGQGLLHQAPTGEQMDAYRTALHVALEESLGNGELMTRTMQAGRVSGLAGAWDDHYDPVPDRHSEIRAKNLHLDECIAQLKRQAARRMTAATAPTEPTALATVEKILRQFHNVARHLRNRRDSRPPLTMDDEYDVQYLLHALLLVSFRDVRPEDTAPSHAGARPRVDFLLKDERIVIEVKKTRSSLTDKELGNELLADLGRYKAHPDCKTLVCFIYDPGDHIRNSAALIRDLEEHSSEELKVRVLVAPQH